VKRYLYSYQTIVRFSEPVAEHSVMLRCQPAVNACQSIDSEHLIVSPGYWTKEGTDSFGNRILYGGSAERQGTFAYLSAGVVTADAYSIPYDGERLCLYTLPSRMTPVTEEMGRAAAVTAADTEGMAMQICHKVYGMLDYVPLTTTIETKATDVFRNRCGVCQDYAHLMIAFCRHNGMAARYVNGFIEGEGSTHAWVEVFDGDAWLGFDPTHDKKIQYGYVKLAHGRDCADCPVCRGMFRGNTVQQTLINVTLQEL